jgi:hypothetical protein
VASDDRVTTIRMHLVKHADVGSMSDAYPYGTHSGCWRGRWKYIAVQMRIVYAHKVEARSLHVDGSPVIGQIDPALADKVTGKLLVRERWRSRTTTVTSICQKIACRVLQPGCVVVV